MRAVAHPEQVREAILAGWARWDAVAAIRAELGLLSVGQIYGVVQRARADGDKRAAVRPRAAEPINNPAYRPLHERMGIHKTTVTVTTLGTGSVACARVPVSVSCLPPTSTQQGKTKWHSRLRRRTASARKS